MRWCRCLIDTCLLGFVGGEYEWWVASCGGVRIVAFSFVGLGVSELG